MNSTQTRRFSANAPELLPDYRRCQSHSVVPGCSRFVQHYCPQDRDDLTSWRLLRHSDRTLARLEVEVVFWEKREVDYEESMVLLEEEFVLCD